MFYKKLFVLLLTVCLSLCVSGIVFASEIIVDIRSSSSKVISRLLEAMVSSSLNRFRSLVLKGGQDIRQRLRGNVSGKISAESGQLAHHAGTDFPHFGGSG